MTRTVRNFSLKIALVLAVFSVANIALAASGAHGAEAHHGSIWDLRWYWVNFILYVSGMFFLLKSSAVVAWDHRRVSIREAVEGGVAALTEAEDRLLRVQRQLGNIDAERRSIADTLNAETARETERIVADAEQRAQRILEKARENIGVERKHLEEELRRELADLVMEKAKAILSAKVTEEQDRSLRRAAVSGIKQLVH